MVKRIKLKWDGTALKCGTTTWYRPRNIDQATQELTIAAPEVVKRKRKS